MSSKLVDRENLKYVLEELFSIMIVAPLALQDRIDKLYKFIDNNILESDKENINELKRNFYMDIKKAKTKEQKQKIYQMYKSIDKLLPKINEENSND